MKFKVGDWVYSSGHICQIAEIRPFTWDSSRIEIHTEWSTHMDTIELWQPEAGEWCWFYFSESVSDHNCLTLGKFIGFRNKESNVLFLEYYDTDNNIFASDMCEPFIGQLPSFIKETK